ncbi:hypothetical protein [Mesorhizobium sp. M0118]|uniref:hypothetical protein n=1 Tax=Mesorhizobium sp. M0118 TaxID=2956884 RepID=UPI0033350FBC
MARRISIVDFFIPAIPKIPIVFFNNMLRFYIVFGAIYICISLAAYQNFSAYAGAVFLVVFMLISAVYSILIGSRKFLLHQWKSRNKLPLFRLPHPVIQNIPKLKMASKHRLAGYALVLMESRLWSLAYGICTIIYYFIFLYYVSYKFPDAIYCLERCNLLIYGAKTISSGIILDFIDYFDIEVSGVHTSKWVSVVSFGSKLVSSYIVIRLLVDYYSFRKRFRTVLRDEHITTEQAGEMMGQG